MNLSDPQTFSAAYDRHQASVYRAAYRITGNPTQAQDVVQDVFLRVWRRPSSFDARRGELGSYLRLMARSRALDLWREGQAAGRAGDRLRVVVEHDTSRPERLPQDHALHGEERDIAFDALRTLPQPQREAVVLAYWGGLTADEIARHAQVPLGTAKSRLRLGLGKLRAVMDPVPEAA